MRKKLLLLTILGTFSTASFGAVDQIGKAPEKIEPLNTYGVAVNVKDALQSIAPKDWQINIQKGVNLPNSVSWTKSQTWLEVLESMTGSELQAQVNWTDHSVFIRSMEAALQESQRENELAANATTPLPTFNIKTEKDALKDKVAELESKLNEATTTAKAPTAAASTTPSPEILPSVVEQPKKVAVAAAPDTTPASVSSLTAAPALTTVPPVVATPSLEDNNFVYNKAVAFNRASIRRVAQAIANTYGMRFYWIGDESVMMKGPVTLLKNNIAEDLTLLKKALGWSSPVKFAIVDGALVATDGSVDTVTSNIKLAEMIKAGNSAALVSKSVASASVSTNTSAVAPIVKEVGTTNIVNVASPDASKLMDKPAEVPPKVVLVDIKEIQSEMKLTIEEGNSLEDALSRFARENGYTLDWKVEGGFEAKRTRTYTGKDLVEVFGFLPKLGLSVDIIAKDHHIVVRPGDAVSDR